MDTQTAQRACKAPSTPDVPPDGGRNFHCTFTCGAHVTFALIALIVSRSPPQTRTMSRWRNLAHSGALPLGLQGVRWD
jgi:hypothetical protein